MYAPAGPCSQDALAPGASYPPITLTVNIAGGAFGSVANTATVSGGGESNTGNDTSTDTAILLSGLAAPVLTLPANGAVGMSLTPPLTWNAASGATSYDVYLAVLPPPLVRTDSLYAPGTLIPNTTYYWQVAARNSTGLSRISVAIFHDRSRFVPITPAALRTRGARMVPSAGRFWWRKLLMISLFPPVPQYSAKPLLTQEHRGAARPARLFDGVSGRAACAVGGDTEPIDGRVKSNAAIVPVAQTAPSVFSRPMRPMS